MTATENTSDTTATSEYGEGFSGGLCKRLRGYKWVLEQLRALIINPELPTRPTRLLGPKRVPLSHCQLTGSLSQATGSLGGPQVRTLAGPGSKALKGQVSPWVGWTHSVRLTLSQSQWGHLGCQLLAACQQAADTVFVTATKVFWQTCSWPMRSVCTGSLLRYQL